MVFCKRNRKATEQSLLNAAAKLFAQKGYENTRTLEIAKEAKANEALIGRYFGGKEGLLMAVLKDDTISSAIIMSEKTGCNLDTLPKKGEGVSFKEAVESYFQNGKLEAEAKEEFMRIAMSRSLVDREMVKIVHEKLFNQQLPKLTNNLTEHMSESKISGDELEAIAMLIVASSHTFNFLGRRIHKIKDKKVDLSIQILIESLELYLKSKKK